MNSGVLASFPRYYPGQRAADTRAPTLPRLPLPTTATHTQPPGRALPRGCHCLARAYTFHTSALRDAGTRNTPRVAVRTRANITKHGRICLRRGRLWCHLPSGDRWFLTAADVRHHRVLVLYRCSHREPRTPDTSMLYALVRTTTRALCPVLHTPPPGVCVLLLPLPYLPTYTCIHTCALHVYCTPAYGRHAQCCSGHATCACRTPPHHACTLRLPHTPATAPHALFPAPHHPLPALSHSPVPVDWIVPGGYHLIGSFGWFWLPVRYLTLV